MLLLISLRGFGDAVILREVARFLVQRGEHDIIHVLTVEKYSGLFDHDKYINLHTLKGGTTLQSGFSFFKAIFKDLKKLFTMRLLGINQTIDFTGDIRERCVGMFVGSRRHCYPKWIDGHPCGMFIRFNKIQLIRSREVGVNIDSVSIYDIYYELISKATGLTRYPVNLSQAYNIRDLKVDCISRRTNIVAVHPFAAQKSRMWNWASWRELLIQLVQRGFSVRIYCAPNEEKIVYNMLVRPEDTQIEVSAGFDLKQIEESLSEIQFCVCLDSFFAHLCSVNCVPLVMINGSNNYFVWAPPNALVVSNGLVCNMFPCYNKPVCANNDEWAYKCIRSVAVDQVIKAVDDLY